METANKEFKIFEFGFTEEAKSNISVLSQWMLVNAIVAFVSLGITIISTITMVVKYSSYSGNLLAAQLPQLLISTVISVALNMLLIQSAVNLKKGLLHTDQGYFNVGLAKMASFFKVMGILTIIAMVFVVLLLLVVAL